MIYTLTLLIPYSFLLHCCLASCSFYYYYYCGFLSYCRTLLLPSSVSSWPEGTSSVTKLWSLPCQLPSLSLVSPAGFFYSLLKCLKFMGNTSRPVNLLIPSGKTDNIFSPLMNFIGNYFEVHHNHLLTPFMPSLLILFLFKLQTTTLKNIINHFLSSHK